MVSTNHFRNRRLTRSGAIAMRRPCECPTPVTPTPPPTLLPAVTWGWNGDGVMPDDIPLHAGIFQRVAPTFWTEWGLTDQNNTYILVIEWNPAGPMLFGSLYLYVSGNITRIDFVSWTGYTGTEPYGPDTQPWNLVTQPVGDDATITLTNTWTP